ncbi:MAG: GWxTD domain-containing protein [Acidobacteria bacterium]|nr:GWxTD domain-containing protein [Acidobacteriota bacterium]
MSALLLGLLIVWPTAAGAQYIGREPERLAALVGRVSGDGDEALERSRLVHAVALVHDGKAAQALADLGPPDERDSLRLRFARVLLRLHAERDLRLPELRATLADVLRADPYVADVFDVWLGLNPRKKELRAHIAALEKRTEPEAAWQRAEVWLRLGDARRAMNALSAAESSDLALRNLADRTRAWAHFQLKEDAAGQAVYLRLLDRLDDTSAALLFRDLAAIASDAERKEFASLGPAARPAFVRRFWAARHPMPVDATNPRLGEHYRRLAGALADYALQSNGRGYFTNLEVFQSFSPTLPYFDSTLVFEDGAASRYWLDPRGLLLVRHGESEVPFGGHSVPGTEPSQSWLVSRYRSRPLLHHFVRRPAIGEWTLVLNLAVAATRGGAAPDDPERILPLISGSVLPLYESRYPLHPLYQSVRDARSPSDLQRFLRAESELVAAVLTAALTFDSTGYYTKDNTLPVAVSLVNRYAGGKPAIQVHFEADLSDIDARTLGETPSLAATVMVYDRDWTTLQQRVEKTFPLQPPRSGTLSGFVGGLLVGDLEPEDYRLTIFIYQPDSGRIGLARGRHAVTYVPDARLGISDLVLLRQPGAEGEENGSVPWLPAPHRVVREAAPLQIQFEVYNLQPDESGQVRYEVEERVLTLYEEPGFLGKLAGYANLAGQMFFPLYTFLGQVGTGVLSQATASETDGLTVSKRLGEEPPAATIGESLRVDLRSLKSGVYTVYVTVRDLHTGELISRFLTFQIE